MLPSSRFRWLIRVAVGVTMGSLAIRAVGCSQSHSSSSPGGSDASTSDGGSEASGSDTGSSDTGTSDTGTSDSGAGAAFANPPELQPDDAGVYQLHLAPHEVTIAGNRYCLRNYNGSLPGPTLRIPAGTNRKVHVTLHDDFASNDYRQVGEANFVSDEPMCHDFNATNLHFHGGHVQPNYATVDPSDPCTGSGCANGNQYYGDNVLISLSPGQSAQYRYDLDEDGTHHPGTDWYHPHLHGSTAIPVVNGATGALIVMGDVDAIPSVAATLERVMMINEIPYTDPSAVPLAAGETCSDSTLSVDNIGAINAGMPVLVNGLIAPRIVTAPGQVERWRFIYAGTPDEMGMTLNVGNDADCTTFQVASPLEMTQYALDGITMPQYYKNDTVYVAPGYRVDVFVPMPTSPQTLCLVGTRGVVDSADGGTSMLPTSLLAIINVSASAPAATTTVMPAESDVTAVAPPTSWTTTTADGGTTQVSCSTVTTVSQKVGLLMEPVAPPSSVPFDGGSCVPPAQGYQKMDAATCLCPQPNISCQNFDDRRAWSYRSDRVATVNTSELWQIVAFDGHAFHIHINPFVVCSGNSTKEPDFPHWRDTYFVVADDGPQNVLMDYRTFTGNFVMHCHLLNHEDNGMMNLVEICDAGDQACLSGAACQAGDPQCTFAGQVTAAWPQPPAPDPALCGP